MLRDCAGVELKVGDPVVAEGWDGYVVEGNIVRILPSLGRVVIRDHEGLGESVWETFLVEKI